LKTGSAEVARLKREKQPAEEAMATMKAVGDRISDMDAQVRTLEERLVELAFIPGNIGTARTQSVSNRIQIVS
jgi:seryl-tRNA synthetase